MPIEVLPVCSLGSLAKSNPEFVWPHRASINRLEPVCQPRFDPSFSINKEDKVFTIGSCFASNIADHIKNNDLEIYPIRVQNSIPKQFRVTNLDFHYNPFTILQTFQWALEPASIKPRHTCYIKTEDSLIFDPTLGHKATGTREEIGAINKLMTDKDSEVTKCRIVIITLGLVECVFDCESGLYLEAWPGKLLSETNRDRYEIHVLEPSEILDALEQIHAVLTRHLPAEFKVILTVSPVPLSNTFRKCDVISANSYSKSSLRTASEMFCELHDNVDYLPVYESVMLSDRLAAWSLDLRHPSSFIVQLNILRMLNSYVHGRDGVRFAKEMGLIEKEILKFEETFKNSWPSELRAFRGNFVEENTKIKDYIKKSETLRRAMEGEIARLNKILDELQRSDTA